LQFVNRAAPFVSHPARFVNFTLPTV